jgi:cytidyltransferase-like protein
MPRHEKVWSIEDLAAEVGRLREQGLRVVHCHGAFDLLHIGHIRYLENARRLGDVLLVTIAPDQFAAVGGHPPAFPEVLRAEATASLRCVDYVAISRWPMAAEAIRLLRPHVFVRGGEDHPDHDGGEEETIRQVGGELACTDDGTFSSSALMSQYLGSCSAEAREYLADFSHRCSAQDVLHCLSTARGLKVLLVGETILDEYQYCDAMGKSGKEPVLATRYLSRDLFAGGVLACANHVAGFCDRVDVLTFLGVGGDQEGFVRAHLKPNVRPLLFYKNNSPTIVKTRFVERYLSQKLFEVYHINDDALTEEEDAAFCRALQDVLPSYDLVIVTDYGHGMITRRAVDTLCRSAPFLAVNTQSNAANHGFNLISKYPRADYVCLAQRELALETRDRRMTAEEMVLYVARKLTCGRVMLTQGKYGSLAWSQEEGLKRVPAFTTRVVDRVGAGDAVLCLTALCVAAGSPVEPVAFLGNVVGAEAVNILGNQRSIERPAPAARRAPPEVPQGRPRPQRRPLPAQRRVRPCSGPGVCVGPRDRRPFPRRGVRPFSGRAISQAANQRGPLPAEATRRSRPCPLPTPPTRRPPPNARLGHRLSSWPSRC